MASVNGIAGVFIHAQDPAALAAWYGRAFGLTFRGELEQTYYLEFWQRDDADPSLRQSIVFAVMPAYQPLGPSRAEYTINYRTSDLRALVAHLATLGVALEDVREQRDGRTPDSTGLFTHIHDPEGNRLELYQPL